MLHAFSISADEQKVNSILEGKMKLISEGRVKFISEGDSHSIIAKNKESGK